MFVPALIWFGVIDAIMISNNQLHFRKCMPCDQSYLRNVSVVQFGQTFRPESCRHNGVNKMQGAREVCGLCWQYWTAYQLSNCPGTLVMARMIDESILDQIVPPIIVVSCEWSDVQPMWCVAVCYSFSNDSFWFTSFHVKMTTVAS